MRNWEEYAYIKDDTVMNVGVFNIGGYLQAQSVAKQIYGDSAYAVNVTNYKVQILDKYDGKTFTRKTGDGITVIVPEEKPTEDVVGELQNTINSLNDQIDSIIIAVTPTK